MKQIKGLLLSAVIAIGIIGTSTQANAGLNVFTDHQVISMVSHGVNSYDDVQFKTGKYPYLGRAGVEYEFKRFSYSLSYIHRSNVDITKGDEYNYNGISLGFKYKYCIKFC